MIERNDLIPDLDKEHFDGLLAARWDEAQEDFEFIRAAQKINNKWTETDENRIAYDRSGFIGVLHAIFDMTANGDAREDIHDALTLGLFDELLRTVKRLADTVQRASLIDGGYLSDEAVDSILNTSSLARPHNLVQGVDGLLPTGDDQHGNETDPSTEQE